MNDSKKEVIVIANVQISNNLHEIGLEKNQRDIFKGLFRKNKYISSKFFYNEIGSKLFEEITQLEEYYPTRTEKSILKNIAKEIVSNIHDADIIELGSGDCSKINLLLREISSENLSTISYIPVDVSMSVIEQSANDLIEMYPELNIRGYVADFMNQLEVLPSNKKRLFCFFGSTIGNLDKHDAENMMQSISKIMNKGDKLLLGMDMVKSREVLYNAYNDSKNITAAFNKNVLNVINGIIGSDFNTKDFDHVAFFNETLSRIEMHLKARKDLVINVKNCNQPVKIYKGESIHTENSHKYSVGQICLFASISELKINKIHTDSKKWFSVIEFEK